MKINHISTVLSIGLGLLLLGCGPNEKSNASKISIKTSSTKSDDGYAQVDRLPYFTTPDFNPSWLPESPVLDTLHKIPNFSFTSQLGEQITNTDLKGHIYIASFFFTSCPSICIQMTENMYKLQEYYREDDEVKLLSHSVNPGTDTVEVLKEYGERRGIDPKKWYLVTGAKDQIYELAREAYFADDLFKETGDKDRFVHTENFLLIDKSGHIRGVYKGTQPDEMERIQRHIAILKQE